MSLTDQVKAYLAKIGTKGGKNSAGVTSPAKKKAARKNGEEGGRPRKYSKCTKAPKNRQGRHAFNNSNDLCWFCKKSRSEVLDHNA